ncbi:hypothetical protein A2G96_09625 [Cupriavidus nantongensis]|uniref:Uncharacterized protein n=1 Tax=Cupriavidus nantongensis TaxID=1796606 RepID=A0A142JIR6_9BURK|nr:hypothetical protein A2G96_09625 [Cupriavidus nantongensis]
MACADRQLAADSRCGHDIANLAHVAPAPFLVEWTTANQLVRIAGMLDSHTYKAIFRWMNGDQTDVVDSCLVGT